MAKPVRVHMYCFQLDASAQGQCGFQFCRIHVCNTSCFTYIRTYTKFAAAFSQLLGNVLHTCSYYIHVRTIHMCVHRIAVFDLIWTCYFLWRTWRPAFGNDRYQSRPLAHVEESVQKQLDMQIVNHGLKWLSKIFCKCKNLRGRDWGRHGMTSDFHFGIQSTPKYKVFMSNVGWCLYMFSCSNTIAERWCRTCVAVVVRHVALRTLACWLPSSGCLEQSRWSPTERALLARSCSGQRALGEDRADICFFRRDLTSLMTG